MPMIVDKYLEKVTSRPSFNYFAFQAATLFLTFISGYIATFQFDWLFGRDKETLEILFFPCFLIQIVVVLVVTFLEFIFFSIRKNLSQKLFSKSLILIHVLFTYLFYSVLIYFCPNEDSIIGAAILSFFFLALFLGIVTIIIMSLSIFIFTIIPVVFLFIIENVGKLKLEPMQYMKNIWAFWFVIIISISFLTVNLLPCFFLYDFFYK